MRIQEELKFNLIKAMCSIQKNLKTPIAKITIFINDCSAAMAAAETAVDLAQSVRNLIQASLGPEWLNPGWYFSIEYQMRSALLQILNSESYSLLNLLIRSNREDRLRIHELESRALRERETSFGSETSRSTLRAYSDRHELDQRRITELTVITDELIDENTQLKLSVPATSILTKISKAAGFAELVSGSGLTGTEQDWLLNHLRSSAITGTPVCSPASG